MTYLDVWRSGTFLLYSCKAAFWIQEMSPRLSDVKCSVVLQSVFAIGSALAYLTFFQECATPPYVHVCHTTWLRFTWPSPALVLQATNAGARRPGYEAKWVVLLFNTALVNAGRFKFTSVYETLTLPARLTTLRNLQSWTSWTRF